MLYLRSTKLLLEYCVLNLSLGFVVHRRRLSASAKTPRAAAGKASPVVPHRRASQATPSRLLTPYRALDRSAARLGGPRACRTPREFFAPARRADSPSATPQRRAGVIFSRRRGGSAPPV